MLSLSRKKKTPMVVDKKPKVESSSSGSSSESDSDWADAAKSKPNSGSIKKKPARRTSRRSVSGTQSSNNSNSDSENDEEMVTSSTAVPPPASSTISSTVKSASGDRPKAGSDLEEGEVSTYSDDSDSPDEFNDGYDDKLMGDAEDQRRLTLMTEKEREQEIFKRIEQREVMRTRFEIEKKLRQARKKEMKRLIRNIITSYPSIICLGYWFSSIKFIYKY